MYWNYTDDKTGRIFPKVLKAIAFLGAEVPAVTNLDSVTGLYSGSLRVVTYNLKFGSERSYTKIEISDDLLARYNERDPEAYRLVEQAVRARQATTSEDYSTALYALRHEAKMRAYSDGDIGRPKENFEQRHRAGVVLDTRAKELVLARGYSYNDGLLRAMDEDPPPRESMVTSVPTLAYRRPS